MERKEKKQFRFGLLGRNISYSFSKGYFSEKFTRLQLKDHSYENFDLRTIDGFEEIIRRNTDLKGLNVTIPYKQAIMPYLDEIDVHAKKIGAVNTIKFTPKGLKGFNTDAYGFRRSLEPLLAKEHTKALILGTGGASKAIAFVLDELHIDYRYVSRNPDANQLSYDDLDASVMKKCHLLVNCTPLGTQPDVELKPAIPYGFIGSKHLLFDLIYNPEKTAFLKEGESRGALLSNGQRMLELQAEKAWEIWNS